MSPNGASRAAEYSSVLTWRCCLICIMAGCGGLLFGYDLGKLSSFVAFAGWSLLAALSTKV